MNHVNFYSSPVPHASPFGLFFWEELPKINQIIPKLLFLELRQNLKILTVQFFEKT